MADNMSTKDDETLRSHTVATPKPSKPVIVYKVRNMLTGEYSTGGSPPGWSKKGKIWTTRGHVTNHLRLCASGDRIPWWWDVVEFELVEKDKFAAMTLVNKGS